MATGYATTTTEAVLIPEIWEAEIMKYAEQNLVMANLVINNTVPDGFDIIHYSQFAKLTAEAVTEGTALTGKNTTPTAVNITIDQQYAVPYTVSKRVMKQVVSGYSTLANYQEMAGEALALQIETALLGLYSGLSQTVTCAAGITLAKFSDAIVLLDNAGAPQTDRHFVFSPKQAGVLRQIDELEHADKYGTPEMIQHGYIGRLYGVNLWVTNNVVTTGSTTISRKNLMFHRRFAEIDFQGGVEVNMLYAPLKVATDGVADILYGYGEKRDTFGVTVITIE